MKQRWDAWWPVAAWTIVILLLTSLPLPPSVAAHGQADKLVHFGLYFGLGVTLARAARISQAGTLALAGLFLAGMGFAAGDELLQNWIPRRAPQMDDWLADLAGLAIGVAVYVVRWRHRWKTEARRV